MSGHRRTNTLVLFAYTAVAFVYFGIRLVPHPGRYLLGTGGDPQIFVWAFAWWPHAIATGQNPIISHAIYAPHGIDLVWATSVPLLALIFAPLTLAAGPDVSANVAALLMPALVAWSGYLLCRYLTGSVRAAIVGGYLLGFSSYMLGEELGHLHMTAVFLVPLIALTVVRYLRNELGRRALAWRLGLLFGLQFWIATETIASAALMLAVSLAFAYWLVPVTRVPIQGMALPLLQAGGLAALIASPLLYYAVTDFHSGSINPPTPYNAELLNLVIPTALIGFGGSKVTSISTHFRGNLAEQGAYLGLPAILLIVWQLRNMRRSGRATAALGRWFAALLGFTVLVMLGSGLAYRGRIEAWLPWRLVEGLPVFDNLLPSRFSLYLALLGAVLVALWLAPRRDLAAWVLPPLAVLALIPAVWRPLYIDHPERWSFFTAGTYKICLVKNENDVIFPFGFYGNSTLWQAETNFWFRMPEGYLAPDPPPASLADPVIKELTFSNDFPTITQILGMVKRQKVDRVLSVDIYVRPNTTQMHRFGAVQDLGGVAVAPACGNPSLRLGVHPTPPHLTSHA